MSGLESESVISPPAYLDPPISARVSDSSNWPAAQPTDAPSACRASGLLEQPKYPTKICESLGDYTPTRILGYIRDYILAI